MNQNNLISSESRTVRIPAEGLFLKGALTLLQDGAGLVVLIQGKNRHTHNDIVTQLCNRYRLSTLVVEFPSSITNAAAGIPVLVKLMEDIARWLQELPEAANLRLGYFAIGQTASAALITAAEQTPSIDALALCNVRAEYVMPFLPLVRAPVLLIAGGRDTEAIRTNQLVLEKLNSASALNVLPRASRAFEEPDAIEESAQLAALWFSQHLG